MESPLVVACGGIVARAPKEGELVQWEQTDFLGPGAGAAALRG